MVRMLMPVLDNATKTDIGWGRMIIVNELFDWDKQPDRRDQTIGVLPTTPTFSNSQTLGNVQVWGTQDLGAPVDFDLTMTAMITTYVEGPSPTPVNVNLVYGQYPAQNYDGTVGPKITFDYFFNITIRRK